MSDHCTNKGTHDIFQSNCLSFPNIFCTNMMKKFNTLRTKTSPKYDVCYWWNTLDYFNHNLNHSSKNKILGPHMNSRIINYDRWWEVITIKILLKNSKFRIQKMHKVLIFVHKVFMSMQLTLKQTLATRHFSTPGMFKNRVVRVFRTLV